MCAGKAQNQLNVVNDGAFQFGGCPNRMDPPTAYSALDTYDKVTVIKGYQSVLNGFGGSGGTLLFEREAPELSADKPFTATVGGGVDANGPVWNGFADGAAGSETGYVRAFTTYKHAENYEDGSGKEVRSSFTEYSGGMILGWTPRDGSELSLGYEYNRVNDALFPGAGMDSPLSEGNTLRLKARQALDYGVLTAVRGEAYASFVDHIMDNYTLRSRTSQFRRVESESDTFGGKLRADLSVKTVDVTVGLDLQDNVRDAVRLASAADPAKVTSPQSYLWPETEIRQIGLVGEGTVPVAHATRLTLGARYDLVRATIDKAGQAPVFGGVTPTPAALYQQYYGTDAKARTEHNLGGLVRLEHDLDDSTLVFAGISRSVRTADATERSIASYMGASSWIGNPGIRPEKHHQLDLGVEHQGAGWRVSGSIYANYVQDYILRDTARGQDGILMSNGATIYRNVDAVLAGAEVSGELRVAENWLMTPAASFTFGQDVSTDRPLAQIPPVEASLALEYQADGWTAGGRVRGALRQTRVDANPATGSGRDVRETPGWVVLDLFASVAELEPLDIRLGVSNLLDATYATHLNRSSVFDPTEVQVNEPGRSFFLQAKATF